MVALCDTVNAFFWFGIEDWSETSVAAFPAGKVAREGSRVAGADITARNIGSAASIAAGSIAAGSIATGSVAVGSIAAGSIAAGSIAAGSVVEWSSSATSTAHSISGEICCIILGTTPLSVVGILCAGVTIAVPDYCCAIRSDVGVCTILIKILGTTS